MSQYKLIPDGREILVITGFSELRILELDWWGSHGTLKRLVYPFIRQLTRPLVDDAPTTTSIAPFERSVPPVLSAPARPGLGCVHLWLS